MKVNFFPALFLITVSSSNAYALNAPITEAEVVAAQGKWGQELIKVSEAFHAKGINDAKKIASNMLDEQYAFKHEPVLFKPTLANGEHSFRLTKESALSYFIGGNVNYPSDKGFALKGWKNYSFNNAGIKYHGDTAYAMSKVSLTDSKGNKTVVDKTWGFKKKSDGKIEIVLHHSSLPYSGS